MLETAAETNPWDCTLRREVVEFHLSAPAYGDLLRLVAAVPADLPIQHVPFVAREHPSLTRAIDRCREQLERGPRIAIVQPGVDLNARARRVFAWAVANILGEPLVQNQEGDRLIAVYARPGNRRVIDGARYHQSREGGGPHTDNVSIPEPWDYLVFSCVRPAAIGGESILIDAFAVLRELQSVPGALEVLQRPFWWEYRGISAGVFQAPIVTFDAEGRPRIRYLRKYLESAHARAGDPLSDAQVWALDVMDAIVERADLQWRTRLDAGDVLVTVDSQVLHARTAFADATPGGPASLDDAETGTAWRFFDRVWVRKRP